MPADHPNTFPKSRRILKRGEFVRVQGAGVGAGSRNFVVIALAQSGDSAPSRLGIVASRKTGNAVARNRSKRCVREWFRNHHQQHTGFDLVVIVRRGAPSLEYVDLSRELDNGVRRAINKHRRHNSVRPRVQHVDG